MVRTTAEYPASTVARVLLVDDHAVVRSGLAQLIARETDLSVCGEAGDVAAARAAVASLRPDVAVVDISLDRDLSGIELIKDLATSCPALRVLVLSMHDEDVFAERVLRAGASGYVMKSEAPDVLIRAIRTVVGGALYMGERLARRIASRCVGGAKGRRTGSGTDRSGVDRLTDRELEVLQSIGRGLGTSRIARDLKLSVKTIETYRARIKEKLGLPDAGAIVEFAVRWVRSIEAS